MKESQHEDIPPMDGPPGLDASRYYEKCVLGHNIQVSCEWVGDSNSGKYCLRINNDNKEERCFELNDSPAAAVTMLSLATLKLGNFLVSEVDISEYYATMEVDTEKLRRRGEIDLGLKSGQPQTDDEIKIGGTE